MGPHTSIRGHFAEKISHTYSKSFASGQSSEQSRRFEQSPSYPNPEHLRLGRDRFCIHNGQAVGATMRLAAWTGGERRHQTGSRPLFFTAIQTCAACFPHKDAVPVFLLWQEGAPSPGNRLLTAFWMNLNHAQLRTPLGIKATPILQLLSYHEELART